MRQLTIKNCITDRKSISVAGYLREVNHYPLISADEEIELAHLIHKGGKEGERAKAKLIKANLRFVITVANQYKRSDDELADLISEGNIGLIKAAELFDETKGVKFISYAVHKIRQSILDAIINNGHFIHIPQHQQRLLNLYTILSHETMQTEQRVPTAEEFAEFADIDLTHARHLLRMASKTLSMDAPLKKDEEEDGTIGDTISGISRTDSNTDIVSMKYDVNKFLQKVLPTKECEVIKRYFGIDCEEQALEAIATDMGISRERTRQIRESGLDKLRSSCNIKQLRCYLNVG